MFNRYRFFSTENQANKLSTQSNETVTTDAMAGIAGKGDGSSSTGSPKPTTEHSSLRRQFMALRAPEKTIDAMFEELLLRAEKHQNPQDLAKLLNIIRTNNRFAHFTPKNTKASTPFELAVKLKDKKLGEVLIMLGATAVRSNEVRQLLAMNRQFQELLNNKKNNRPTMRLV